jgi:hypothetical protein
VDADERQLARIERHARTTRSWSTEREADVVWPLPSVIARSAKAGPNVSLAIDTSPVIELVVKLKPPDDEPSGMTELGAELDVQLPCRLRQVSPTRKCGSWITVAPGWCG